MKRFLSLILALGFVSFGANVFAATVASAGPGTNGKGKFAVTAEYDGVTSKDVKVDGYNDSFAAETYTFTDSGVTQTWSYAASTDTKSDLDFKVADAKSNRALAVFSYGILDNLDVIAKLGTADVTVKGDARYVGDTSYFEERAEAGQGFTWAIGAKGKIHEFSNGLKIGASGQYLSGKSDLDNFYFGGESLLSLASAPSAPSLSGDVKVSEWQLACYASKTFGKFTPYGGLTVSKTKFDVSYNLTRAGSYNTGATIIYLPINETFKSSVSSDQMLGLVLGSDVAFNSKLAANLEVRLLSETAVSVGLSYKF